MSPFDIPRKGASSNACGKGEPPFAVCIEFAPLKCMSTVEGAHINSAFGAEHGSADRNLHSIPVSHAIPRPRSADEDCALRLITHKTWWFIGFIKLSQIFHLHLCKCATCTYQ